MTRRTYSFQQWCEVIEVCAAARFVADLAAGASARRCVLVYAQWPPKDAERHRQAVREHLAAEDVGYGGDDVATAVVLQALRLDPRSKGRWQTREDGDLVSLDFEDCICSAGDDGTWRVRSEGIGLSVYGHPTAASAIEHFERLRGRSREKDAE